MLQLPTIIFLITFSMLAAIHYIALELFLYWRYWWFDIPMHCIGGAVVALGIFTLYDLKVFTQKRLRTLVPVLCGVLLVALLWEVYEVLIGIPIEDDYVLDTSIDVLMGLCGGVLGYFVGSNIRKI